MVTIKLALLKGKRAKDGTYKIRIAIGHKSETHYITTRFSVNSPSQFSQGVVVGTPDAHAVNVKLRHLLNDYEQRLERVSDPDQYSAKELRGLLKEMRSNVTSSAETFTGVTEQYVRELRQDGRDSYAEMLTFTLKRFKEYTGGDMFLSQFSTQTVTDYERWMRRQGMSQTTISMHLSMCRTIINRAIRAQLVRYDVHPFTYWKRPADEEREIDISVEDMRKIRDYTPTLKKHIVARDIFLLSYYLGGINMVDLLAVDFRNIKILEYVRHKSRNTKQSDKRISFTIQPEAQAIIDRYRSRNGKLDFGYKFAYKNFVCYVNNALKEIAITLDLDIGRKICYYSARKSFVQHGFDLGISLEVLEYCIGQSVKSNRPIFNYLKIMRRHADNAMRMIFDNLNEKGA